ncbi:hypothetical protein [Streptosporangium sp. NPDC004631]
MSFAVLMPARSMVFLPLMATGYRSAVKGGEEGRKVEKGWKREKGGEVSRMSCGKGGDQYPGFRPEKRKVTTVNSYADRRKKNKKNRFTSDPVRLWCSG